MGHMDGFAKFSKNLVSLTTSVSHEAQQRAVALPQETTVSFSMGHLAVAPEFFNRIQSGDKTFAKSDFFQRMSWIKDVNDDLYDPSYTDMLRQEYWLTEKALLT